MRRGLGWVVAALLITGCSKHKMTRNDCEALLDAMTKTEFERLKINDPKLLEDKTQKFRSQFHQELEHCEGLRISRGVLRCLEESSRSSSNPLNCFG